MKNNIEIPSYFTSLFDSSGQPVSVTIYESFADEIEYSKIYVDILKGYSDYYEILDVMMDFYEGLSDTPGVIFDIKKNQIGVDLLSYEEKKRSTMMMERSISPKTVLTNSHFKVVSRSR